MGNRSYQLTSAGRSAHGWQIGRHWLAGNSHFPCGRIFIFCFSEPLGINSEVLNCLLLGKGLFIQIYFGGLWPTHPSQAYLCLKGKQKKIKKIQKCLLFERGKFLSLIKLVLATHNLFYNTYIT